MRVQNQLPKVKLIETAARLVHQQGWNATGINQILGEAKVPKGSFYYYFQSKDDLGVAILRYQVERLEEKFQESLLDTSLNSVDAFERFLKNQYEYYETEGWRWGCPVGSFANEVADSSDKLIEECRECDRRFRAILEERIVRGQREGLIQETISPEKLAEQFLVAFQGSLLRMKMKRSGEPLKFGFTLIREMLFGATS